MKGARGVAVLDVKLPEHGVERDEWEERGIRWFECDVGRIEEIARIKACIVKEVCVPYSPPPAPVLETPPTHSNASSTPTPPSSSTASPPR